MKVATTSTQSTGLFTNVTSDYDPDMLQFMHDTPHDHIDIAGKCDEVKHVVFGSCGIIDITKQQHIIRQVITDHGVELGPPEPDPHQTYDITP